MKTLISVSLGTLCLGTLGPCSCKATASATWQGHIVLLQLAWPWASQGWDTSYHWLLGTCGFVSLTHLSMKSGNKNH